MEMVPCFFPTVFRFCFPFFHRLENGGLVAVPLHQQNGRNPSRGGERKPGSQTCSLIYFKNFLNKIYYD